MWHPHALAIRGRTVLLRRFFAGDITGEYITWLNDPVTMQFSNQRFRLHDRASCEAYLATFENSPNLFISIHDLKSGDAVGTMTAYMAPPHGTVDVGILIGNTEKRGLGYGYDAWKTLLDWLDRQPGVRKVTAGAMASNIAMIRLLERSGMSLEACLKGQEILDGVPQDILKYAIFSSR